MPNIGDKKILEVCVERGKLEIIHGIRTTLKKNYLGDFVYFCNQSLSLVIWISKLKILRREDIVQHSMSQRVSLWARRPMGS